jgi:hypothetical protein
MGMIMNSVRGVVVCVPRNMQQAAGMYNTLLQSDDAALVIECLNGYRSKERLPSQPRRVHRAHRHRRSGARRQRPHPGELRQHLQPLRQSRDRSGATWASPWN